ncbi:MAG: isocitrate/isopropylmalate dehydrogenase family protein [Burkholderiaceae bacterium]|nr:isocitrate/isopropylmalate dehydrogenase family protein [Burkholderiaceae bacterium]
MQKTRQFGISVIEGDGIGPDVVQAAVAVLDALQARFGGFALRYEPVIAGARYYRETGLEIESGAFERLAGSDAILLGAIGLPDVRRPDGTEISPHLEVRDRFGLYAGVRPAKAYPNAPRRLLDERAAGIDLVVLRESTEGLFFTQGRGEISGDAEARETLRITRPTSEKLFDFAFRLARRRKARGGRGLVTCVDKANVFRAFAFFRKIFDERRAAFADIDAGYAYVDAMALDLIRHPWDFDVLVTENMFGDILSDLTAALVGGMGIASCGEIGDAHALFQPAHGSAPDIVGQDRANPLATILSAGLMLDYLGERHDEPLMLEAAQLLDRVVTDGFAERDFLPVEFGGRDGTRAVTRAIVARIARY